MELSNPQRAEAVRDAPIARSALTFDLVGFEHLCHVGRMHLMDHVCVQTCHFVDAQEVNSAIWQVCRALCGDLCRRQ